MLRVPGCAIERRRMANFCLAATLALAGLAAMVLYRFPPSVYGFYPVCPVHKYLHLECPGCGTTRALAALLRGRFAEALRLNAVAILLVLPLTAGYGLLTYIRAVRGGDEFRWPQLPTPAVYAGVGVILAFTVLRNL